MNVQQRHPDTTTLALMIWSGHGDETLAAQAIEQLLWRYADETKADLYARIVESVMPLTTLCDLEVKVNAALWATLRACAS